MQKLKGSPLQWHGTWTLGYAICDLKELQVNVMKLNVRASDPRNFGQENQTSTRSATRGCVPFTRAAFLHLDLFQALIGNLNTASKVIQANKLEVNISISSRKSVNRKCVASAV